MELALNEVKIQAKKLLKAIKTDSNLLPTMKLPLKKLDVPISAEIKLKDCLNIIAHQLGFENWYQAQVVLSGSNKNVQGLDMGTFFYPRGADIFINEWFANYQQAKNTLLEKAGEKWLLPYKKQFIVVKSNYISTFKLDKKLILLWTDLDHDMVDGYKSKAWDKLACEIIKNRSKNY
jgi:hypothetical protein